MAELLAGRYRFYGSAQRGSVEVPRPVAAKTIRNDRLGRFV